MPWDKYEPSQQRWNCRHPEHNPPSMQLLPPGSYTWRCPACGKKTSFTVSDRPTLDVKKKGPAYLGKSDAR